VILPQWLDVDRLPPEGLALEGALPLTHCERLAALLAAGGGTGSGTSETVSGAHARVQCRADAAGRVLLQGELNATLHLQCQRCLEPMPWTLHAPFEVLLLAEDPQSQGGLEYALLEQGRLNLWQTLEDEVMLALPFAPRHDPACPPMEGEMPAPATASPFAVLAQWRAKT
jgi:uncharacterized protein